jgi:hypothetical protein
MFKKPFALSVIFLMIVLTMVSCKKSTKSPVANGNAPHALSDSYYIRALLDTTWIYVGSAQADECQTNGSVCSSFLIYGANYALWTAKINLTDSANPLPQDSVMLKWAGKTFVAATDTTVSHAYTFSFEYPDSVGRALSSNYIINNTGAKLTVESVVYNGLSQDYTDSLGHPLHTFLVKGAFSCRVTHFGDSTIHSVTQGAYCINMVEGK